MQHTLELCRLPLFFAQLLLGFAPRGLELSLLLRRLGLELGSRVWDSAGTTGAADKVVVAQRSVGNPAAR
jgi:hypothetical protein